MNDTPKRTRPSVLAIVTAVLAVPMFGGGLLLGRSLVNAAPTQALPAMIESAAPASDDAVSLELAACQQRLGRRTKARTTPSAMGAAAEEPTQATEKPTQATEKEQRQIEALQGEIKTRRRSTMLHNAFVCKTVRRHVDLMMGLPDDGKGCRDKRHVVDLIHKNHEKCAEFGDIPPDLDAYDLTDEERGGVLDAVNVAKSLTKEDFAQLDLVYPACLKKSGKRY